MWTESCVKELHATSHDVPYIAFGTKGWGEQMGQRVVLVDTMGHPLFCGVPWELRDGMDRWHRGLW